ncbi:PRP1 splicing factor N-terminal-domain-containing protein [Penicillium chermesinum]|nr:PRP1 splicing factor N-terminal-domain-containing protein [Penicillium chermesinum]
MKKNVARRAIENNRTSIRDLERSSQFGGNTPSRRASFSPRQIQLIPLAVELWLALARMEKTAASSADSKPGTPGRPYKSRNLESCARLHEQTGGSFEKLNIMERAVKALSREDAMPKREEWIGEAERCEEEGDVLTCASIIRETLDGA